MRLLVVPLAVLALALPAAAGAVRNDPGDGTLAIKDGRGTFTFAARGGVIGSFVHGSVVITDPIPDDGTGPIVSGDDWSVDRSETTTVYGGAMTSTASRKNQEVVVNSNAKTSRSPVWSPLSGAVM